MAASLIFLRVSGSVLNQRRLFAVLSKIWEWSDVRLNFSFESMILEE